jgi:hypothetical protein
MGDIFTQIVHNSDVFVVLATEHGALPSLDAANDSRHHPSTQPSTDTMGVVPPTRPRRMRRRRTFHAERHRVLVRSLVSR